MEEFKNEDSKAIDEVRRVLCGFTFTEKELILNYVQRTYHEAEQIKHRDTCYGVPVNLRNY